MVFSTKMRGFALVFGLFCIVSMTKAQTATDGLFMERGQFCAAVTGGYESFDEYWEGTLKRDNPNLGTVSYKNVSPGFALGLHKRVNLLAGVSYFSNKASAGVLSPEKGLQDFMAALKIKAWSKKLGPGNLELFATLGFSAPISNYKPDYLPLCLGLGSTNGFARGIFQYRLDKGIYVHGQAGYTGRSNIKVDRTFYYVDDTPYYTNDVDMPNVFDWSASIGFLNTHLQAEVGYGQMNTLGGGDIRRNDMPFPSYNMDATRVSAFVHYFFKPFKNGSYLGLIGMGGYTLDGRNVGQTTGYGGGVTYQFKLFGPAKN